MQHTKGNYELSLLHASHWGLQLAQLCMHSVVDTSVAMHSLACNIEKLGMGLGKGASPSPLTRLLLAFGVHAFSMQHCSWEYKGIR